MSTPGITFIGAQVRRFYSGVRFLFVLERMCNGKRGTIGTRTQTRYSTSKNLVYVQYGGSVGDVVGAVFVFTTGGLSFTRSVLLRGRRSLYESLVY